MKDQQRVMLERHLTRYREVWPSLPPDERMDPMQSLRGQVEMHLILAKQERNPEEVKAFEEQLKIVAEMEAEENSRKAKA